LLSQNDIFYLKQNEISKICSGDESGLDYRKKIQKRKNSFSTIKANGIPKTANFSSNRQNVISTSNRFYGIGCCTGLAKGKVRIISNGNSLSSLKQGEIAVCYNFRPAWSIILWEISGLIVEQGNVLSHGAILAREYGVPTVVNIPGIVSQFDNGNLIEVDGSSGFVSLIAV
jgi:pyruvate,water dikinase